MPSDPMQELEEEAARLDAYADGNDASNYESAFTGGKAAGIRLALSTLSNAETHLPALKAAGGWRPSREEVARIIDPHAWEPFSVDPIFMLAEDRRRSLAKADSILALGAVPEGGEERNSASVDESSGSPPAAAKSESQHSAGGEG